ncbi:MAG: response regulator [Leptolyngbya sp. IPPAS B-1204]
MTTHPMPLSSPEEQLTAKRSLVLAVDDDDDNLFLLSYALELLDCEFVGKTSGQSAVAFVKERQPDLILLDVILPDMHGTELLQLLKQTAQTRSIPVIAVTGLASCEDRTELLNQGFSAYLSKPYMVEDLEALVRQYL